MSGEPATVSERRVDIGGLELNLREAGSGPPLLLLHGWPQHSGSWRELIGPLSRGRHVIAPDLRGFGRSDAPRGDYRKHALAADVVALLDAERIERADVIGHDWGGWIAFLLAIEHPERVDRFVTLDIPPPWPESRSAKRIGGFLTFASYQYFLSTPVLAERTLRRSPAFVRKFIRAGSSAKRWTDEELDSYAVPLQEPARAHASSLLYRSFLTREVPPLLRGTYTRSHLEVPGLALLGERSPITRMLGVPEPRRNLRVELVPAAGHYLPEEAPEEVLALAQPFLDGG
jgi:pimeloyl-ACP methyl ester carboxylesterase